MGIYLIYVISPLLIAAGIYTLSGHSVSKNKLNRKRYLWISGIVITLMIGLRHYENGSGDSYFYYRLWETLSTYSFSYAVEAIPTMDMEQGFLYGVWFLSHIFPKGQWAFLLSGMLFATAICSFVDKNCENVIFPILVFNCLGLFNFMVQGMRQSIAICICLFAIEACKGKNLRKFLLLICLAMAFHASAIIFLPVYWLDKFKLNAPSILVFTVCCGIGFALLPTVLQIVNTLMNEDYSFSSGIDDGSGVIAILIYVAIISFGLLVGFMAKGKIQYTLFLYMAIFGMVAMLLRNMASGIAERASYYYVCSQMAIISNSISRIKSGQSKWLISIMVALLCIGVAIHKASYSILIPYKFFWQ